MAVATTTKKKVEPGNPGGTYPSPASGWWKAEEPKVADVIGALVKTIRQNGTQHQQDIIRAFRLYGNFEARGIGAGNYFLPNIGRSNRLTLNVVKSCVDTLVARTTKSIAKPTFLTDGGSWRDQKKAKLLDKFVQGLFYQTDFEDTARKVFRDACIFGKGIVKILEDERTNRVAIERVFPDEILVDEMEAVDGKPRQIFQQRIISRDVLRAMFDGDTHAQAIITKAKPADLGSMSQRQIETADLLVVIEAWHLPSGRVPVVAEKELPTLPDRETDPEGYFKALGEWNAVQMKGHDGRHSIIIESGTLVFDAWKRQYFPFVWVDYNQAPRGFWPSGIPMDLLSIQYEINKILRKIQESIDWCVPKAFVEASSKVVLSHLDDIAGGIIRYSGAKPEIAAQNTISPQLLMEVDKLVEQAYQITGISELAAQGKKPSGLESGASIREYHDIETERFADREARLEGFVMNVARMAIRQARDIHDRIGHYGVTAPIRRRATQRIDWSEIDLDDDDYIMQVFPTSSLPKTPAGRLAMVQDLVTLGFLDKEDVLRLLDFPDIEAVNELMEAAAEFTNMQIEDMVERGKSHMPLPFQNLQYALKHAQAAYMLAATQGIPEENLQNLESYMQACVQMAGAAGQPTSIPGSSPGGQPGIPGGPPGPAPFGVPGAAPPPPPGAPPMGGAPPSLPQ